MRIDGIHIVNFLPFDEFSWTAIDPRLAVVVGPNDAGQSRTALNSVAPDLALTINPHLFFR